MSRIYKIKNFKIENFEIAKSFLGSLRVQRYIVFMSLHDSSASYWTSKNGLQCDLSKMPEAITRWPLLVELQYWLRRLQRVRLPYRPSFRFLWNMRVLILEIFGRFVLECPLCFKNGKFIQSPISLVKLGLHSVTFGLQFWGWGTYYMCNPKSTST